MAQGRVMSDRAHKVVNVQIRNRHTLAARGGFAQGCANVVLWASGCGLNEGKGRRCCGVCPSRLETGSEAQMLSECQGASILLPSGAVYCWGVERVDAGSGNKPAGDGGGQERWLAGNQHAAIHQSSPRPDGRSGGNRTAATGQAGCVHTPRNCRHVTLHVPVVL